MHFPGQTLPAILFVSFRMAKIWNSVLCSHEKRFCDISTCEIENFNHVHFANALQLYRSPLINSACHSCRLYLGMRRSSKGCQTSLKVPQEPSKHPVAKLNCHPFRSIFASFTKSMSTSFSDTCV